MCVLTQTTGPHQSGARRPAGYAALVERHALDVIPNWHTSYVLTRGVHKRETDGDSVVEEYPATYWPGDEFGAQLEFALKYDGTNLAILARLFEAMAESEILGYVRARPMGKYVRRAWFLYEFLTGRRLLLDDLPARGSYVDLLDPNDYYTTAPSRRVRRQRINDNLLGNSAFCPTVRRTDMLRQHEEANLSQRCLEVVSGYPQALLKRALGYLYEKETKSSFAIERVEIDSARTERFVVLLRSAADEDYCQRDALIGLQNRIMDPRFRDEDYRQSQNYVGQSVGPASGDCPFRWCAASFLESPHGGVDRRPPAHGLGRRAGRHSRGRNRIRVRLPASVRGWQRPHPPLPDPTISWRGEASRHRG